jgi:hypothetical protein
MKKSEKADEYAPNSEGPKNLAIKNTKTKELTGVDIWVKNDAPVFLAIFLTVFIDSP